MGRGRLLLERLERRDLLTIYGQTGVTLAPSPVEGTAFAGAVVGTFASTDSLGGLSATIDWGPTATPTSSVGTINLIGSVFVPGIGTVPQYSVTGGTTYPTATGSSSQPITVTISDTADSTNGIITSSTTVADAPLTTTGGIASASVTEGARVNYTGAIALMTFTDGNPNSTASEFSASVSWGDGTPATLGTITKAGATYTVSGIHTYPEHTTGTPYTLRVNVSDLGGSTATHATAITVTDAALSGPTAFPVQAAEGQPLSNATLGTFLDGNPSASAADFTVSINWGDGTTNDPGFATLVGGSANNAKFAVGGSHVYASAAGSPYAVTVSVTDSGGATTTINTAATVNQTPLSVTVGSINAVAAAPTAGQVVARFFDAGGADPVGNYSATVRWGDGTSDDTAGGVSIAAVAGQAGLFAVTAPAHTYATPGLYPITVSVDDSDPTSGGGTGFALVAAASLTAVTAPTGPIAGAIEGSPIPSSTEVAGFTSGDPNALASGFTAVVDWGDGTPSTVGTITQPGGVGTAFLVTGGHTYAHLAPAGHAVAVRITDAYNHTAVATTPVTSVADAPLIDGTPLPVAAAERVPTRSIPVATFIDANPAATAADFAASIDWGDGAGVDANAQVVLVGGNASGAIFAVYGSHTFAAPGRYSIVATVADVGGQTLTITPIAANVTVAPSSLGVAVLPQATRAGTPIAAGTVIGTFTDASGGKPVGQYAASIDWGDGSAVDTGVTITSLGGTAYGVSTNLGHAYSGSGSYALKLTVSDAPISGIGGNLVVVNGGGVTPPIVSTPVLAASAPIVAVEGTPLSGAGVAFFNDANPGVTSASLVATINWGDGSPATAGIVADGAGAGHFVVRGNHTYARRGAFVVGITLADSSGNVYASSTTAIVANAALSPIATPGLAGTERVPLANVAVGSFVDANPGALVGDYLATISWGDGGTSLGDLSQPGGAGTAFVVRGSHIYADAPASGAGPYPISVVVRDEGGQWLILANAATVADVPIVVSAVLNPADDHGSSNSDGITNDNMPSFLGSSEPGSTIALYVTSASGTMLAGRGVAGADGRFTVQVNAPLPDGAYTVGLVATDASGHTSASIGLPQQLVIDTVGPRVTGLRFNRSKGRIVVTLADDRSGLDRAEMVDGANYQFSTYVPGHPTRKSPYSVTSLTATPAGGPTEPQTLTIAIQRGRSLPGGRYLLTIDSAGGVGTPAGNGLCDVAGNALDGEFYGSFASGNSKPGGDLVAGLNASRQTTFAPVPSRDGYATPNNPIVTSAGAKKDAVVLPQKQAAKAASARLLAKEATPRVLDAISKSGKPGSR